MTVWSDYTDEALIERARAFCDVHSVLCVKGCGYRDMYEELAKRLEQYSSQKDQAIDRVATTANDPIAKGRPEKWRAPEPFPFEHETAYLMRVVRSMEDYVNGQA